ncbi:MAG: hypothetical protein P1P86_13310 [Bacteroidales bacterium]|nr:hypothetical protein [Bacteroidales bacterium]
MELLIIILLCLRVFFNLIVLPDRLERTPQFKEIQAAEKIVQITGNSELKMHPVTPASIEFIYYLSTARNEILRKEHGEYKTGTYYIFDAKDPLREGEKKLMEFESRIQNRKLRLSLITGENNPPGS